MHTQGMINVAQSPIDSSEELIYSEEFFRHEDLYGGLSRAAFSICRYMRIEDDSVLENMESCVRILLCIFWH
jgi:hypothetical protein